MTQEELEDGHHDLDFDAAKSMRYHLCRRRWWDTWNRLNKIMGALSGSAVVVGITSGSHFVTTASGTIVALFSIFDLVFDFSERARFSDGLYRGWSKLAQDLTLASAVSEETLQALRRRRLEIEMEEGPVLDVLERRCSREEAIARDLAVNPQWKLTVWEARFAQWIFWTPTRFGKST